MADDVISRIKRMMIIRDKKAATIASDTGLSRATISRVLNGERRAVEAETLRKIAKSLETTIDYLTGATDDYDKSDSLPLPDYAIEVMETMRKLDSVRNYELLLIARTFFEESESIMEVSQEEIRQSILDLGDEIVGEEETNRVMRILELLQRRRGSRGLLPSDNSE